MDADVLIIGSGMGGASLAAALAPSGRRILILERGERLQDSAEARDPNKPYSIRPGAYSPEPRIAGWAWPSSSASA